MTDPTTHELLDWIAGQHHRMTASVAGLSEDQLRARLMPSGWSMLGLLGHVRESTRFWLHHVLLGNPVETTDGDQFPEDPPECAAQVTAQFAETCAAAIASVRHIGADAAPGWWPDGAWGGYRQEHARGVLLHLLTEVATHAGHLDIARELTDGGVWDFATDGVRNPSS